MLNRINEIGVSSMSRCLLSMSLRVPEATLIEVRPAVSGSKGSLGEEDLGTVGHLGAAAVLGHCSGFFLFRFCHLRPPVGVSTRRRNLK